MRWRVVAGIVLAAAGLGVVSPAWACGCGGYMPELGAGTASERARVYGERALVQHANGQETITLAMTVRGSSKKAAWIMPVPSQARVQLGDRDLFGQLAMATRPRKVYRTTYWPFRGFLKEIGGRRDGAGAPAAGGGVDVRQQMRLGPFEVARLGATDPTAVTRWLATNGYVVPDGLAANLAPYVMEKWEIIAVRLAPEDKKGELSGETPPLRLSFASDRIVYPMRLSKGATTPQTVTVYVATGHRVEPTVLPDPSVQPELVFAGRADVAALSSIYLTAYSVKYDQPGRITNDFTFAQAPTDDEFRQVVTIERNNPVPVTLAILAVPPLAGLIAILIGVRRRRTARLP
ncbi:DUF2330 domain-containing protein [Kribbella deserti]|uniref:DUF2330 domain-containing protein n=1 Tax=Kribbella deserti TaxID=1926257 RepID=A0ABV6QH31_9ACTN